MPMPAETPALTVVIITRDRRAEALACIARHLELPEQPAIVVVDNGSSDNTAEAIESGFPQVRVARTGRNAGGAARNIGVRLAETELVAFSDDDSWWEPGSLAIMADFLARNPGVALGSARILIEPGQRADPASDAMAASPLRAAEKTPGVLGFLACSAVVRRDAFLAAGGFDERYLVGGEERPLALALAARGWRLAYVGDATVHHAPSASRDGRTLRAARMVRNDLWTAWSRRRGWGVARATLHALRGQPLGVVVRALRDALAGAGWVLREREPVPESVERDVRLLEAPVRSTR